ncbi:MAG: universal stress protein [Jatrophihabitans sp.]
MSIERAPVVVGVDESPGTDLTLMWAIEEARSRGVPIRLVYAYGAALTYSAVPIYGNLPVPELPYVRGVAAQLLARAVARVHELAADLEVDSAAVGDDAALALIDESARACTVVLGSRHLGAAGSVLLGSVGAAVSARADCPVVVLRGLAGLAAEHPGVVVGVDGKLGSEAVIGYAFDYASRRDVPLHAVLCWHPDLLAEMMWRAEPPAPALADLWLAEALAGWQEKYPDVVVHSGVVRDHPVTGLVAASTAQHLLVVGTRGRSPLVGTILGSVSQGVLHHATCPVAVIPSPVA